MDEVTKYRMTGAIIWLSLLVMIVPSWYGDPVDYAQVQPWLTPKDDQLVANPLPPVVKTVAAKPIEEKVAPAKPILASPSESKDDAKAKLEPHSVVDSSVEQASPAVTKVAPPPVDTMPSGSRWYVRLVSYQSKDMADQLLNRLENAGYKASIGQFTSGSRPIFSVRAGPFASQKEANQHKQELDKQFKTQSMVIEVR